MQLKRKYLKIDTILKSNSGKMNVAVKWLRMYVFYNMLLNK